MARKRSEASATATSAAHAAAAEPSEAPLRLVYMSPSDLAENPRNWRTHPEAQTAALTNVIAEVGWAGACLYNERTGRLIDGHARRKVAIEQGCERVPVLVGDWSEEQERKILATLDPLAAMADADNEALADLLRGLRENGADLPALGWPDHKTEPLLAAVWAPPAAEDVTFGAGADAPALKLTPSQRTTLEEAASACRREEGDPTLELGRCLESICRHYLECAR